MLIEAALGTGVIVLVSMGLTAVARKWALSRGALDLPNQRSSHTLPTPRGGGVATVVTATAALAVLASFGRLPMDILAAFGGGGVLVAGIGLLDDNRGVSTRVRLAVHAIAATWAVIVLGGLPPLQVGEHILSLGWVGNVLAVLAIVWTLNLFNFMDGIDGIAASEAIFIALGGAVLALWGGSAGTVPVVATVIASACAGFLVWNWPPAKIFMGDVGSGYLGYVIAVLALTAARENPVALFVWLILGGVFFVDATFTLVRRFARRERVFEAHRSHAYQRLAQRWSSHRRVTMAVVVINVVWLLPAALFATAYPNQAVWIAGAALVPVLVAAVFAGAGRTEAPVVETMGEPSA